MFSYLTDGKVSACFFACAWSLLLPQQSFSQSKPARIEVGFIAEGAGIKTALGTTKPSSATIDDGAVLSGEELIQRLGEEPNIAEPRSKYLDAGLIIFVQSGDDQIPEKTRIARCKHLDLYAEPVQPTDMIAQCDGDVYKYRLTPNSIVFTKNEFDYISVPLSAGFYLINGAVFKAGTAN